MANKNFPLLNQIDDGVQSASIDWNKNAFQTLLTSNLAPETIFHYAINVGLQRLENSLYETYWDATADALNDLSQFLLNPPFEYDAPSYSYEAKCQLLMYSGIAMIKMHIIRRRSTHDAKMACATICSLLLQQSQPYELPTTSSEHSACCHSMRSRYLKRIFITGQWLPTLSKAQFTDLESNYERYIALVMDQLFAAVSLRDQLNSFIDHHLFNNQAGDDDAASREFVFIRRFPVFTGKIIDKHDDLIQTGLVTALDTSHLVRKLICCIWTLCCTIEADRVSSALPVLSSSVTRDHFSLAEIDFEQKPIDIESLNQRDVIVFLLLCAQQNVLVHRGESTLHPYLLFSSSHLCTQQQKNWWQAAIDQTTWSEFVDHLATIRLDDDRLSQHPPTCVLLETARILLQSAVQLYEHNGTRAASAYEQYARHYLQIAKDHPALSDTLNKTQPSGNRQDKLFFFYAQKSTNTERHITEQCDKLVRQCDELKLIEHHEIPSVISSPIRVEVEEPALDSTVFATPPPAIKSRDVDVQTVDRSPSPSPSIEKASEPPLPPYADLIFTHMNTVNQRITEFCASHEAIQNDINTIRDRLERINRATSQMISAFSLVTPTSYL